MKKTSLIIATFLAFGNVAVNGQDTQSLPYNNYFDSLSSFTIIDANEDGNIWTYASYDPYNYSPSGRYTGNDNAADEWLITPAFEFKKGYSYKFSLKAIGTAAYTNNIEVKAGKAAAVEEMNISVAPSTAVTTRANNYINGEISVEEDGVYYVGVHLTAEANQSYIYIDDLKIEEGLLGAAPVAISDITATPAAVDAKPVMNLTFTAPDKTNNGDDLTEITNIIIYRNDEKIADLGETVPGASVTYTDTNPATYNTYKLICVNEAGEGAALIKTANIIFSAPADPTNVLLTATEDGQTITWDPVTTGKNSAYLFIPENVTYTITRSDKVEIAKGVTECKITDTYVKEGDGQNLISYTVMAVSEGGNSSAVSSNKVLVGNPYEGEFAESFANYSYTTSTWQAESGWNTKTSSYYSPAISADQDGNNGFVAFSSYSSGTTARLISPIINVSAMQNPCLSFYFYHAATTYTDMLIPELLIDGEYVELSEGITVNGEDGWTKYNFYLTKEQTAGNFQLSFKAVAGGGYLVSVDNITIKDVLDYNLTATGITAPANLEVGKSADFVVNVKNNGANAASEYKVTLYRNGEEVASEDCVDLANEATANVVFAYTATPFEADSELEFSAEIVFANDMNADDNAVAVTVAVNTNDLPTPTNLNSEIIEKTVELTWEAPVVPEVEVQPVKTESFEEWEVGSTESFNDWTFVDVDGTMTSSYVGFGNSMQMAFMTTDNAKITPNSGNNYLVSVKCNSSRDYRNDWAISPEVVGGQTISFKVCNSGTLYGYSGTQFEVCYSSTDTNIESFIVIGEKVNDKHEVWTEYTFDLPENAKYFAIHVFDDSSSSSSDAFAIDDIKFQPGSAQLVHTGYNVYRNGVVYQSIDDVNVTSFTDSQFEKEVLTYTYAVSALYTTGESLTSNAVMVDNKFSGIESIADNQSVYATEGMLNVIGYKGEHLSVYNVSGQTVVAKMIAADNETIALNNGMYIVTIADKALKVVVK